MHTCLKRVALAAAVVVGGTALTAAPAAGDGAADAWTEDETVNVRATTPARTISVRAGSPRRGGAQPVCTYGRLDDQLAESADRLAETGWTEPTEGPGAWYRYVCQNPDSTSRATLRWLPERPGFPEAPDIDPEELARQALASARIPSPGIGMSPDPGRGSVVNVETWLWMDGGAWAPVSATTSAGPVSVTATATPEEVVWDMGNGDAVSCAGPGTPYEADRPDAEQQPSCSYTYRRGSAGAPGSAFTVTATVTWRVTWAATGAPGGGGLGTVSSSSSTQVRVGEIQAVNQ